MTQFRVMTWNVENLFPVGPEAGPETEAELDAKLRSLTAVIDAHNPDVVALQEVGGERVLARLQERLASPLPNRQLGIPDERGIRVALISGFELHERLNIQRFPTGLLPIQIGDDPPGPDGPRLMNQMGRGALRARVTVGNRDVHLLTAHLKSKLLSFPGGFTPADEDQRARYAAYALYRRAAEATTLRSHLNTLLNGAGRLMAVILAGDLNDEVDAATTQILNGPPGSEIGTSGFHRSDRGDGDRLWNLAPRIPVEQRFSRVYRGRQELIDHIFVSNFLVANNRTTAVTTAAAEVPLPSIADDPTARRGKPGSDHSAVIATFDL